MLRSKYLIYLLLLSSLFSGKYIAVLDLEPMGISDMESQILTQALTSKIIEAGGYTVVERANIEKILKEQKFQHSGCTDSDCAVEIGQLLNADFTVMGTAGKFGSTYTIQTRIINVETGEAVKSAEFTHKGEIDELLNIGIQTIVQELLDMDSKPKRSAGYDGIFDITSIPTDAEVYLGDTFFGKTPIVLKDIPPGNYDIKLKYKRYYDYTTTVKLSPRQTVQIDATLKQPDSEVYGYITFSGSPSPAKVSILIDGMPASLNSMDAVRIAKGDHLVKITNDKNHRVFEETVSVKPGKINKVKYSLK